MPTYTLHLYQTRPGSTVETGQGAISFEAGDDENAIRYAKSDHNGATGSSDHWWLVEGERFVWESKIADA